MGQLISRASLAPLPEHVPILKGELSPELRQLLFQELALDEAGLEGLGFQRFVDNPDVPGHNYMEGYFHAIHSKAGEETMSVHPRKAHGLLRRPAPPVLFAFCEAFRRSNAKLFQGLQADWLSCRAGAGFGDLLRRQMHMADVSAQVHWGDEVGADNVLLCIQLDRWMPGSALQVTVAR
eukprot:TRINITY_DN16062_c0_g1_i1.p1 TRINITY_DN16062_c0_g1~~TRINITY_DN16062_c0_g1_i1.p1  ORF type:complete len:200 (+),score=37.34 TRINITY_DN16062_c0_g1_i1:65-601(+)